MPICFQEIHIYWILSKYHNFDFVKLPTSVLSSSDFQNKLSTYLHMYFVFQYSQTLIFLFYTENISLVRDEKFDIIVSLYMIVEK